MNSTQIKPSDVQATLSKHILADGYDMVFDMEKSNGVWMYDSKNDKKYLDFFTCFASVPLGYNHPKMIGDEQFKKDLMMAALTNPSNSDIYTTQYAHFVETFGRVGIPSYLPNAFFIAGGSLAIENTLKVAMDWKVQKNDFDYTLKMDLQCAVHYPFDILPLEWTETHPNGDKITHELDVVIRNKDGSFNGDKALDYLNFDIILDEHHTFPTHGQYHYSIQPKMEQFEAAPFIVEFEIVAVENSAH